MKIKHICGWLLLPVLCILLMPSPVHADVLEWAKIDTPGLRGNIIVSPSEVSEIAVGSRGVIYALDNSTAPFKVYRSTDSGSTWEDISAGLVSAGAILPATRIVVAPDRNDVIAVVTDLGKSVYLSTDGGSDWSNTGVPAVVGKIRAIAISKQYVEADQSVRELAIGTAVWGDNTTAGQVWVIQLGNMLLPWQNQNLTVDLNSVGGEVSAIAYSPSYQRDNTLLVVAATGNDTAAKYQNQTWLSIGKRDTAAGATLWNSFSGYPAVIAPAGDAPGVSGIFSSLALPSNYSGSDDRLRRLFVSYDRESTSPDVDNDVYRLDDEVSYRLNANTGARINISSIAYYGTTTSGKLLAGDVGPVAGSPTVRVRRTTNPFDTSPTWRLASVPPSGPGNAKVSWSQEGDLAYCGTGQSPGVVRDESAFSMSSDGGDNWQQLSLIDTTITLTDIAISPDSSTLFAATSSLFGPEGIWRTASTSLGIGWFWSRQLIMNSGSNRTILRLSPNYALDYTVYAAESGGTLMAVSHNRGNTWKRVYAPGKVIDMVIEDEDTSYVALAGGIIKKSVDDAFTWPKSQPTGLPDINMLAIAEKGTVLVGGRNGEVAYSIDGGSNFTRIPRVVGNGDVQVIADVSYPKNGIIYAATASPDEGIWRWTIGVSTNWEQIDQSMTTRETGERIGGLVVSPEGALYALRLEPVTDTSGGMTRSLDPAGQYVSGIEFSFTNAGLPAGASFNATAIFPNAVPYLNISQNSGRNELWSIDTANGVIYRFQDTLATKAPTLISPPGQLQSKVNATTGRSVDIVFTWNRPSSDTTDYELGIYSDAAGTSLVKLYRVASTDSTLAVVLGPSQSTSTNRFVNYTPGATYYWRVRSTKPVVSPWSETQSFTIEKLPPQSEVSITVPPIATITSLPAVTTLPQPTLPVVTNSSLPTMATTPPLPSSEVTLSYMLLVVIVLGLVFVIILGVLINRIGR